MYRNGHHGAALLFASPVAATLFVLEYAQLGLLAGGGALALAMVPDWDQRVPFITHRGITHTAWFALLVGAIMAPVAVAIAVAGPVVSAVVGFITGTGTITSHIAADALTPAGVTPWAPLDDTHYSLDLVKAKSTIGNYALLGLGIVAAGGAVWVGSVV